MDCEKPEFDIIVDDEVSQSDVEKARNTIKEVISPDLFEIALKCLQQIKKRFGKKSQE